ncbi:MAG: hypothetical protein SV062_08215 [Thermodesulfobacteriota bacterium]|nr:hypothetical protein [Thermodesulfobacteriota bacterium]
MDTKESSRVLEIKARKIKEAEYKNFFTGQLKYSQDAVDSLIAVHLHGGGLSLEQLMENPLFAHQKQQFIKFKNNNLM